MKKLHFSLMAILFALFSMVSFTACSSSDDDDTSASGDIKTNIVGTWELTHIKGWYWADDEDESHIIVDKSPESDDKFRFSLNANGGCIWYDYDAGTWKSYSGITKYELNANILIIKDSNQINYVCFVYSHDSSFEYNNVTKTVTSVIIYVITIVSDVNQ